jgi:hypothetical protein
VVRRWKSLLWIDSRYRNVLAIVHALHHYRECDATPSHTQMLSFACSYFHTVHRPNINQHLLPNNALLVISKKRRH